MKQPITIILKSAEVEPTKRACESLSTGFKVGPPFTGSLGETYTSFTVYAAPEDVFSIGRLSMMFQDQERNETNF